MEWFNVFALVFIAVIMIPNIIFAVKHKDAFENELLIFMGRFSKV